ncbi:putative TOS1-like glycosyl hydrolase-domain-containing protein [Earliella scabrosa]|nr:putative TOS1-like glycosyl hydrolase-domain-containing protein [Earliella scabrosa]
MNIHNIAVYQPGSERGANASSASWKRVSVWAAGEEPENLVFMNNMGGGKSGEWSICSGASQSYASGDWTDSASVPNEERAKGVLDEDHEINIMTAESCATRPCTGFSRGTAHHGWGGSKLFVFTFDMPPSSDSSKAPAIWALNAQIVRAAQYGCNCRGVGPGGCGELDILETLPHVGAEAQGISEIYGPKGATGSGARFFARPTGARATYGVIFDVRTDAIAIQEYEGWDYGVEVLTRSVVDGYLGADAFVVPFEGSSGKRRRDSVLGAHRRRRVSH